MSDIKNHMPEERRREYFRLRGLVRHAALPKDDVAFVMLRREYENNRPRQVSAREAAAIKQNNKHIKTDEEVREYNRVRANKWRMANRERWRELTKESYNRRREHCIANAVDYERRKMKADPLFKALKGIRCRIFLAIRKGKSKHAIDLIGCTRDEFVAHIEKQFKPGMTWDNWSFRGWHLDHVKPVALFDMNDLEQRKACFHYTNLQPLWAHENLSKSDTYTEQA